MKHRQVVVDQTAIVAALRPADAAEHAVRADLMALIDAYEAGDLELVTHSAALSGAIDHLERRGDTLGAVEVQALSQAFDVEALHPDLRAAAAAIVENAARHDVVLTFDAALTVETARRRGTRRVLSLDPSLQSIDLDVLPVRGQSNPA